MSTYKKIIILNNPTIKNYNGSAMLTLIKSNNDVFATLKTFNISTNKNLILGLSQNQKQICKQNITLKNNTYEFKINSFSLKEPISCVLVEDEPDKVIPLVWGNSLSTKLNNQIINNLSMLKAGQNPLHSTEKPESVKSTQEKLKYDSTINLDEMFDIEDENEINDIIDTALKTDKFFENLDVKLSKDTLKPKQNDAVNNSKHEQKQSLSKILGSKNVIEAELENLEFDENEGFFESISAQVEDLFNKYPTENNLEQLIPNSKWVKIDYENNGDHYVLGLIYDDTLLRYIAYGVPGEYAETSPNGLDNYSQWLPINPQEPTSDGYWVMYQDALTGQSILVDAI